MTPPPSESGRLTATTLLALALLGAVGFSGYSWFRAESRLNDQARELEQVAESVESILGEITRMRIEQSATGKGTSALLEKLKTYAPLTADARITEPDYQNALKELKAIVRAFESCGDDAWGAVTKRLEEVDPKKDFSEIKWLLELTLRLNPTAGKQITKDVILGHRMPYPRLRWLAADLLISHDQPLAGNILRKVLLTESSRGIDITRAQGQGMQIPDKAAFATTGFHNFVLRYIRSEDSKLEDTLLMLLSRVEHDAITIQECVKELGKRKSTKSVKAIKRVYDHPPLGRQNPLLLTHCLRAIHGIEGSASKPWLEEKLRSAPTDTVANFINTLLNK